MKFHTLFTHKITSKHKSFFYETKLRYMSQNVRFEEAAFAIIIIVKTAVFCATALMNSGILILYITLYSSYQFYI